MIETASKSKPGRRAWGLPYRAVTTALPTLRLAAVGAATFVCLSVAWAQGEPAPADAEAEARTQRRAVLLLRVYDRDQDGVLSSTEYPTTFPARFERLDKDGSGTLSAAELAALVGKGPKEDERRRRGRFDRLLRSLDANEDGALSKEEWSRSSRRLPSDLFASLDKNKDGVISADELAEAQRRVGGTWRGRAAESLVRRFDKDGDRRISKAEWLSRADLFDKLDADHDGFLSLEELSPAGPNRSRLDFDPARMIAGWMKRYDKNKDGKIAKAEYPDARRFAEFDDDRDGFLTPEELRETFNKRMREREYDTVERYDRNGDGKVTPAEYTGPAGRFRRLDRNGDGVIDGQDR